VCGLEIVRFCSFFYKDPYITIISIRFVVKFVELMYVKGCGSCDGPGLQRGVNCLILYVMSLWVKLRSKYVFFYLMFWILWVV
jgi:hypothetical protein